MYDYLDLLNFFICIIIRNLIILFRAMKEIWLEKYRPKKLSDVFGNTEALSVLRSCVQQGYIPHLILAGPPGTGKTSSVLCIVN